mmetsp:Transcript_571/g.1237  ORF Transcript_571/g.1237 Transcript_571/m.1237 type:complete len:116 (-) Transcript_571:489-836(-)
MHGRLANGSGAALAAANVGGSVAREDLAAAFQKDTDGKKVAFNCDPVSCFLSEVWTAWAADPAKKLAPAAPIDYKDIKGGPCPATCTQLGILAWSYDGVCPEQPPTPRPPPPRGD